MRNSSGYLLHIISVFFSVYVISEIIKTLQLSTIAKNPVYVSYFKIEMKWQLCKVQLQLK